MVGTVMIETLSERPELNEVVVEWLRGEWNLDPADVRRFLEPADDRPGALVAIVGERAVGALAFIRSQATFQSSPELWVNAVYVEPAHRRKGIGCHLVRAAVASCQSHGFDSLFAYTDVPELYRKCGWTRLLTCDETGMSTMVCNITGESISS